MVACHRGNKADTRELSRYIPDSGTWKIVPALLAIDPTNPSRGSMLHSLPFTPTFYVTTPQPCPYLEGKRERKLFTSLHGTHAEALNNTLSKRGFRRSQNFLYRPTCPTCSACLSVRVPVEDFAPSKSQRRIIKRNADLKRRTAPHWATEEQYALFRDYIDCRHPEGGMTDMDIFEFAAMLEDTSVETRIIEYVTTGRHGRRGPSAVCLTDVHDDGLSMVYSFFDPARLRNSLGTYVILDHIALARQAGLKYVYLGYWVPGSKKMDYKGRFNSIEVYRNGRWGSVGRPSDQRTAQFASSAPEEEHVATMSPAAPSPVNSPVPS